MRADSAAGRLIGALARVPIQSRKQSQRGLDRNSPLGRFIGALAREKPPPAALAHDPFDVLEGYSLVAVYVQVRATTRNFQATISPPADQIYRIFGDVGNAKTNEDLAHLLADFPVDDGRTSNFRRFKSPERLRSLSIELRVRAMDDIHTRATHEEILRRFGRPGVGDPNLLRLGTLVAAFDITHKATLRLADELWAAADEAFTSIYDLMHRVDALRLRAQAFTLALHNLDTVTLASVDASGTDLRCLRSSSGRTGLEGVIWTRETLWPPELAEQVREWSDEIIPGVFEIRDGSERQPSELITA